LIAYGTDQVEPYREAADYVDRILNGERPIDLPVKAALKYETVLNMKTAKATLGLEIPAQVLSTALPKPGTCVAETWRSKSAGQIFKIRSCPGLPLNCRPQGGCDRHRGWTRSCCCSEGRHVDDSGRLHA
jgi:hypothetical protein